MIKNLDELIKIADCIAAQFGKNTEVCIHDFSETLEHSIKYIVNGHVSGRSLGDSATNLLFEKDASITLKETPDYAYISVTPDGKTLKSSTINYRGENGAITHSMCINQDITDLIQFERTFDKIKESGLFNHKAISSSNKLHSSTIQDLLENIISEAIKTIGVTPNNMNKESKLQFLQILDKKGVFTIQKSSKKICEILNISKFTLYNYLDEVRGK